MAALPLLLATVAVPGVAEAEPVQVILHLDGNWTVFQHLDPEMPGHACALDTWAGSALGLSISAPAPDAPLSVRLFGARATVARIDGQPLAAVQDRGGGTFEVAAGDAPALLSALARGSELQFDAARFPLDGSGRAVAAFEQCRRERVSDRVLAEVIASQPDLRNDYAVPEGWELFSEISRDPLKGAMNACVLRVGIGPEDDFQLSLTAYRTGDAQVEVRLAEVADAVAFANPALRTPDGFDLPLAGGMGHSRRAWFEKDQTPEWQALLQALSGAEVLLLTAGEDRSEIRLNDAAAALLPFRQCQADIGVAPPG